MKKFLFSIFVLLFIFDTTYSQFDGKRIPPFLSAENYSNSLNFFYKPSKFPKVAYEKHAPSTLLGNTKFKVLNISGYNESQTETWISINPKNPKIVVAASNDSRYNTMDAKYMMGAYYTSDGGSSWAVSTTPSNLDAAIIKPPTAGGMTNFDPGLAFDSKGNLFYCYGFCQTPENITSGDNGIFVVSSTDGGKTWGSPSTVIKEVGKPVQAFHDRYTMTADINAASPYKDNIYIAWQRFNVNDGVCFSTSKDQGTTWSTPIKLDKSDYNTQSPSPSVGPNGEIYVVWQYKSSMTTTDAVIQRSLDGGKTWLTNSVKAQTVRNLGLISSQSMRSVLYDKQSLRISSYPSIAVDCSESPRKGTIYIVQNGKDGYNNPGVLMTKSIDNGLTWSATKKVDENKTGTDVFMPSISVDPINGNVSILYYSSQNDSANIGVDAYLAFSPDGVNFKNIRLTANTWYLSSAMSVDLQSAGNSYYGDYTSIASYNGRIYPCFWMPNAPNGMFWTNNAYVALISDDPQAPENLTVANSSLTPSKVTLNWIDPTEDLFGNALQDFKIIVYKDNIEIGQVNKGVLQFVDNSAEDGKKFTYSLRTRITPEKESELVSVTVIAGGSPQPLPPTNIACKPVAEGIMVSWTNPAKHIDSSVVNDLYKIDIYSDNVLIKSVQTPDIQAGMVSSATISSSLKAFHSIKLIAVGKRNTTETQSEFSDSVVSYSGAALLNITENFDNSSDSVVYYSKGVKGNWGKTNKASYSLPFSMTDSPNGKYVGSFVNDIIFAPVRIQSGKTMFNFRHIAIIDPNGDFGIVKVSRDFGKNWDNIAWFNQDSSSNFTDDVTTSNWQWVARDLKKYEGDTLYIAFSMVSNPVKIKDGWYIDNIQLNDGSAVYEELSDLFSKTMVEISPNPASDKINLRVGIPVAGYCTIEIDDVLGSKIKTIFSDNSQAGEFNFDLSINDIQSGVYYIKVTINGISKTSGFVKIK